MLVGIAAIALSACAVWRIESTPAGPGVPIISNLRVEPAKARVGESVQVTFDFEDTDADLIEARIFPSEFREWVYRPAFAPKVLNLRAEKHGLAIGQVETRLKWESEGIRIVEVFVVDEKNHTSNGLRARVAIIRR
ncbi:protein of unknown function [Candidatus Methylomirabilis oxygeniifera]|uniref:Uncharacterized protein n=1 Tax=Methylomirabilis oxygeniifera TaxID=671143 RepID=D5MN12_METO1|nr:protein of unknown function [Candidatus Methylomirabilis oxyfera]